MSASSPPPSRWEKLGHSLLAKTRIFDLLSTRYRHPHRGTERDFIVLNAPDWVNVVAVTPDNQIVLVRQFRYGIDEFSLEVPGGVIEPNEDPVVAGLRELQEETGFTGGAAKLMGCVRPNPAIQSNRCFFVLVENAVKSQELAWDADEEIQVITVPVEEAFARARNGGIVHGLVLNALMLYEPHWRSQKI